MQIPISVNIDIKTVTRYLFSLSRPLGTYYHTHSPYLITHQLTLTLHYSCGLQITISGLSSIVDMKWIVCGLLFAFLVVFGDASNVLVLDTVGSPSHQVWMHRLTRAVADHGYNVTTLTCKVIKDTPKNLHVYHLDGFYQQEDEDPVNFLEMTGMTSLQSYVYFTDFLSQMDMMAMESLAVKQIMNFPKDFYFDLIIYDYLGPAAFLVLADRFPKARLIGASAYPAVEYTDKITSAPHFPAFIPNLYMDDVKETFVSRLESFLIYAFTDFTHKYQFYPASEKMVRGYTR